MRLEGRQRPHRLASALRRSIVQRKIRAVDGCGGGGDAQREAVRQRRHRTAQSLEDSGPLSPLWVAGLVCS